jgi:hypothetical protein
MARRMNTFKLIDQFWFLFVRLVIVIKYLLSVIDMFAMGVENNLLGFGYITAILLARNQRAIFANSVLTWKIGLGRFSSLASPAVSSANICLNKSEALYKSLILYILEIKWDLGCCPVLLREGRNNVRAHGMHSCS